MTLASEIRNTVVAGGELAAFWLGQAGFLLKDEEDRQFVIDPYLTDCGNQIRGFKRLSPMLLEPEELFPNYYLTTHLHFDHFDYDAIQQVAENGSPRMFGPPSCIRQMHEMGIAPERCAVLEPGASYEEAGFKITAVRADHGAMAPDAIGAVVEMGGHCLYFSGDTAFHPDWCRTIRDQFHPDTAFLSVNGAFGNMDAAEGAQAAGLLGVALAIPCHFWTFTEHGGEPQRFKDLLAEAGGCRPYCMRQGELLILPATEAGRRAKGA